MSTLYRPRRNRVFAGVCAAIAYRFGLKPNTVRILAVISCILPGPQILIYLIMWWVIPNER